MFGLTAVGARLFIASHKNYENIFMSMGARMSGSALSAAITAGDAINIWSVSPIQAQPFAGTPALAEDRVGYRFINGFVDVGDLPCRKAFWAEMKGRSVALKTDWPVETLYAPEANRRVEFTSFWYTPTHVQRWCRTTLSADQAGPVRFRLATCGGVRIWVNGGLAASFEPLTRNIEHSTEITLPLQAGENTLIAHMEEICERDTVWFFELTCLDAVALAVPLQSLGDPEAAMVLRRLADGVRPERDVFTDQPFVLLFGQPAPAPVQVRVRAFSLGHDRACLLDATHSLPAGQTRLPVADPGAVPPGYHALVVTLSLGSTDLERKLDAAFMVQTVPPPAAADLPTRKLAALHYAAANGNLRIGRVLAMLEVGLQDEPTLRKILDSTLLSIEQRYDCSDFSMVTLLWVWAAHADKLPEDLRQRVKAAILGYRYWVDEPGNDTMWFWSENHTLCFHVSQALAGALFPQEIFSTSGRTGAEQAALGTARLHLWFESVEDHGLVEWNSAAYYPIDFIGLFGLHQWAEPAIAQRAKAMLDKLFIMIGLHTLAGVPAGSMGRAYDKELRAGPLTELASFCQVAFGEGWLNGGVAALPQFCASAYLPPLEAYDYARPAPGRAYEARYTQGLDHGGRLILYKTAAVQLSTVVDHRTGEHGHQQHVIDIRLHGHPMARLWINHPGEDDPWGHQRPSYWAGNGVLPRVGQWQDTALMVFNLGDDARLPWTHAFAARDGLDFLDLHQGWLVARSGQGSAALWASGGLTAITSGSTAGREFRAPGHRCGWVSIVADTPDDAAIAAFLDRLSQCRPTFDADAASLAVTGGDGTRLRLDWSVGLTRNGQSAGFTTLTTTPRVAASIVPRPLAALA